MSSAVILAGGYSSRMNQYKMALPLKGRTVIEETVLNFTGICSSVYVVCGHRHEEVEEIIKNISPCKGTEIIPVFNQDFPKGMFTSVQAGCKAAQEKPEEDLLIIPGDMPAVKQETIRSVARAPGDVVIPGDGKHGGHPVKLSPAVAAMILDEPADSRLNLILGRWKKEYITTDDPGIFMDIDVPEDYRKIDNYLRTIQTHM